jgi:hypothetical protein
MIPFLFVAIGIGILLVLAWLLFSPHWSATDTGPQVFESEKLKNLNCRHFPQIGQVLRNEDLLFIQRMAPAKLARRWRKERSRILRRYLNGLAKDFARLEHLARLLAALSPEISRKQEWEWLKLGMQFRILFVLVNLRISLGSISIFQLARLTDLIVVQATNLEILASQMANAHPAQL